MNRDIIAFTKYKFNVYGNKDIRSGKDSAVVGIVGKSKSLDFPTMLIFWSLVRNSVVLAVYLLFSVACFLTVHEHCFRVDIEYVCYFLLMMQAKRHNQCRSFVYLLLMSYLVSLFVLQFSVFTDDGPAQFVQAASQHACFGDLGCCCPCFG